jgi:hypothetical protein
VAKDGLVRTNRRRDGGRARLLAGLVSSCLFALLLPAAPALAAADLLPDLVASSPGNAQTPNVIPLAGQNHLVLRFNGAIHNIGAGKLDIRGSGPVNGEMTTTWQRIYRDNGTWYDYSSRHPQLHYENTDGHDHWHLKAAARWSMWNSAGTAEVAPAMKVGFCLEDGERVDSFGPLTPTYDAETQIHRCREGEPTAPSVFEGISPGWQDVYGANVYFQWIDVTNVAPGNYRLAAQMDPNNIIVESNESNNGPVLASTTVAVPGYVASNVSASVTLKRTITLAAQKFGSLGARQFKIQSAPAHGTLGVAVGTAFSGPGVSYTPNPGFLGSDGFTFSAVDSTSAYPLTPVVATASVKVSRRPISLLSRLRFSRNGRTLVVKARAKYSGKIRLTVKKGKRRLGSCRKRVKSKHGFRCKIKLRSKGTSLKRAKLGTSLRAQGVTQNGKTYKLPRRVWKP